MAYPSASYQWYKSLEPVVGATDPELPLVNASTDDSGVYYCVATNSQGTARTRDVAVVVNPVEVVVDHSAAAGLAFDRLAPTPNPPIILSTSPTQLSPVPLRTEVVVEVKSTWSTPVVAMGRIMVWLWSRCWDELSSFTCLHIGPCWPMLGTSEVVTYL